MNSSIDMHVTERVLTVVVAVEAAVSNRVVELKESIEQHLPRWQLTVEVLVFRLDRAAGDRLDSQRGLHVFHQECGELPIVQARNLCQQRLHVLLKESGGLGLVLDDDLRWTLSESSLEDMLSELTSFSCSMALLGISGDPPVPREYVRASPLLDFLFHQACGDTLEPIREYVNCYEIGSSAPEDAHHDLYSFTRRGFFPFDFDDRMHDFFSRLYHGKATTRTVVTPDTVALDRSGRRGGATLILNPNVLSVQNSAVVVGSWVGRRSDMAMAIEVQKAGYSICRTPVVLEHIRQPSFDSCSPEKLVCDLIGAGFVEHLRTNCDIKAAIRWRLTKSRLILLETTQMLNLCFKFVSVSCVEGMAIRKMIVESEQALSLLNRLEQILEAQSVHSFCHVDLPHRVSRLI